MSDLTDHPSRRLHIPRRRHTDLELPPYGSHGHIDPVSTLARVHAALVDTRRWVDGMVITDVLGLVRTRHEVQGEPLYLLHELYPLGRMDPDLVPGLLRKALRHHEDHRLG
jgi:hypothetical protein